MCCIVFISFHLGKYLIQKVVPQATGESSKVKVKVRVNIHGIFSVSSASLVEVQKSDETEEPMETEQVNDKEEQVQYIFQFCGQLDFKCAPLFTESTSRPVIVVYLFYVFFIVPRKPKMQTDPDEQQSQGDGLNETEENMPEENEEMQVIWLKLINGFLMDI